MARASFPARCAAIGCMLLALAAFAPAAAAPPPLPKAVAPTNGKSFTIRTNTCGSGCSSTGPFSGSNKCWAPVDTNYDLEGTKLEQLTCNGQKDQDFYFEGAGTNCWYIHAGGAQNGLCVDAGGEGNAGDLLRLYTCNKGLNQKFCLGGTPSGGYTMSVAYSSRCANVAGGFTENHKALQLWYCSDTPHPALVFHIYGAPAPSPAPIPKAVAPSNGRSFTIRTNTCYCSSKGPFSGSNRCWAPNNGNYNTLGTNLEQVTCNGKQDQDFYFESAGTNCWYIHAGGAQNGLCVDAGDKGKAGDLLRLYTCFKGSNQKFCLGGTPSGGYSMQSAAYSGMCVNVLGGFTAEHTALMLYQCSDTPHPALVYHIYGGKAGVTL